jgi:vacuolar-type H+-ATPase subunit I/STV1
LKATNAVNLNAVNLNAVNDKPEKRRTPKKPRRREQATQAGLSVGERVVKRKRLAEVQREIEEISRKLETEMSLYKIVELRKELKKKEEERDDLYKETQNGDKNVVNMDKVEKTLTLMQRRAENQVTRKQRKEEKQERERVAKLLTRDPLHVELKLSLTDRKAMNAERIKNLQRAKIRNEFARASRYIEQIHSQEANDKKALEEEEAARMVKKMATDWENPEAKKARKKESVMEAKQKSFYSQLASNGNAPNELKKMMVKSKPKPRPRKRFGLF